MSEYDSVSRVCVQLNSQSSNYENDRLAVEYIVESCREHPNVELIKKNITESRDFSIEPASDNQINNIIKDLDHRRATGLDKILLKIVKNSVNIIYYHLTCIVSNYFSKNLFSILAKVGSVRLAFKKNDRIGIEDCRLVSNLDCFVQVYEKILNRKI